MSLVPNVDSPHPHAIIDDSGRSNSFALARPPLARASMNCCCSLRRNLYDGGLTSSSNESQVCVPTRAAIVTFIAFIPVRSHLRTLLAMGSFDRSTLTPSDGEAVTSISTGGLTRVFIAPQSPTVICSRLNKPTFSLEIRLPFNSKWAMTGTSWLVRRHALSRSEHGPANSARLEKSALTVLRGVRLGCSGESCCIPTRS